MLGSGTNHLVSFLCAGTDVYRQFGLRHPLVVQLLEQLPNSEKCSGYHFTYHHPEKLSSWQATVSSFMTCFFSLCFTPLPGPLILPSLLSFVPLPTSSLLPPPFFPSWRSSSIPLLPSPSSPPSPLFLSPPPSSFLLPPSSCSYLPFREQHSTPVAVLGLSHFVGKSQASLS